MSTTRRRKKHDVAREFDPSRWAHLCFALGGFMGAWVFANLVEDTWAIIWSYYPQIGRPVPITANSIGIGIGLLGTILAWRRKAWFDFVNEVAIEVSQVTWPTRAETRAATIVVIVITLICSVLLSGMDLFWSGVTDWLYGI
jgi:preprotein translocase subunit SecE